MGRAFQQAESVGRADSGRQGCVSGPQGEPGPALCQSDRRRDAIRRRGSTGPCNACGFAIPEPPRRGVAPSHPGRNFSDEKPLSRLLRQAFQERNSLAGQRVDLSEDATTSSVAVTTHFVRDRGGLVAGLVMLRDAGTRAQLKDQIGLATKLAALGRLTSGVAHEVKNPLSAMSIQIEIIKSKLLQHEQSSEVQPQLDILTEEIRRLDRVVKTLLDFTRPLEIRRTEINLTDVVREVFTLAEPQARKYNVKLILEPNGALPPLRVDRDLIKQALLNLVLNGCQAMPNGG